MKRTSAEAKIVPIFDGFPVRLHIRNDIHLARKIWHFVMGMVIVFIYLSGVSRVSGVLMLASALGFDLFLETLRLRNDHFNTTMLKFWGPIMRSHEFKNMSTAPHYICSSMLAIGIFPKPVAVLSILYLACGDPMASLIGILYGNKGPRFANGKSAIGTAAGVVVCALVTFIYLKSISIPDGTTLILSIIGGLAGGMVELFPFDVDDNFTIPVISGFILWLAFMVCGI